MATVIDEIKLKNGDVYKVGSIINGMKIVKILDRSYTPLEYYWRTCYTGVDIDDKVIFELFDPNGVVLYKRKDNFVGDTITKQEEIEDKENK